MKPRLYTKYENDVRPALIKSRSYKNVHQVPRIEKIVVNMGVGRATQQQSLLDGAVTDLTTITGQKPLITKSKKAIASFTVK